MYCNNCGNEIVDHAKCCNACGSAIKIDDNRQVALSEQLMAVSSRIASQGKIDKEHYMLRLTGWFFLTNLAVIASLGIISRGALVQYSALFIVVGSIFPFIMLFASKWLAKRSHNISIIREGNFSSEYEKELYGLVKVISERANIEKMPEVGLYESEDMNAFATGFSKNNSMIALSTGLLEKMSHQNLAAVIAHEISHIANGDMIILTIIQSVVNAIVLMVTLPIQALRIVAFFSDNVSWIMYFLLGIVKIVIQVIALFIANLVIKAFSRSREYRADKLAAKLVGVDKMIGALQTLSRETVSYEPEVKAYAALKINSSSGIFDIFSTHPSIEKRINRLQSLEGDV